MLAPIASQLKSTVGYLLSRGEIERALFTYPPAHRFLGASTYLNHWIHAELVPFRHPFHEPIITHLSREHSITYATQAAYLLMAAAITRGDITDITLEEYLKACRDEQAHISKVQLKFHRSTEACDASSIDGRVKSIRRYRHMAFVICEFSIDDVVSIQAWLSCPVRRH